ncbi:nucleotide exchange factor GrpE [Sulfuriflexus sp.]|uniref:nucleotide exchange factor GrpE n=1 Tax=Sulfuriflexus sp. TaxID=2015443 RepID=UPI0028CF2FCB|nr:nucleotide exchange factor GrpE [Sulfuriflexus sp.]MDT8404836.1 nucleotide exchange factor GrpE [Sulfuriflexus sp.]
MSDNENATHEVEQEEPLTAEVSADETPEQDEGEHVQLLEDARAKVDEHWNLYLRTQAELENLRRRAERDVQNAHKFGLEKFINELLPVIDSMEMGMAAANAEDETVKPLLEGMELTLKMFQSVLEKMGVSVVNPENEVFNPDFHQAMSMQETADVEPNTVLAVMQKGYVLNERLVRPAMVVVSKAPTE